MVFKTISLSELMSEDIQKREVNFFVIVFIVSILPPFDTDLNKDSVLFLRNEMKVCDWRLYISLFLIFLWSKNLHSYSCSMIYHLLTENSSSLIHLHQHQWANNVLVPFWEWKYKKPISKIWLSISQMLLISNGSTSKSLASLPTKENPILINWNIIKLNFRVSLFIFQ